MHFGPFHYVPVIKNKQGEYQALSEVFAQDWDVVTPLLEVAPHNPYKKRQRNKVTTLVNSEDQLIDSVRKSAKKLPKIPLYFVDLGLIDPSLQVGGTQHPVIFTRDEFRNNGLAFVPVVRAGSNPAFLKACSQAWPADDPQVVLRLRDSDLGPTTLRQTLSHVLGSLNITPTEVHLVLDYEAVGNAQTLTQGIAATINALPSLHDWRTLTVTSCSFPDVGKLRVGNVFQVPREDWAMWNNLHAAQPQRLPSYGDYNADQPGWINYDFATPGDTFRYTTHADYIIQKSGELRKTKGAGYKNACHQVCKHPSFSSGFSWADGHISLVSSGVATPGNGTTFRQVGTNRHVTVVARQISGLAAASAPPVPVPTAP